MSDPLDEWEERFLRDALASQGNGWPKDTVARLLATLDAERARQADPVGLREALEGLDQPFQWLTDNYPKAMREMPTYLMRKFDVARDVLASQHDFEPMRGPDDATCARCLRPHAAQAVEPGPLDVERLADAISEVRAKHGANWSSYDWLAAKASGSLTPAEMLAAEYARLSPDKQPKGAGRCQYLFAIGNGAKCQAVESHPIHHGVNDGPDDAHEFLA